MDIHGLRYAVALAEEASFSRAAARLGVTQPSLSEQIKKLEAEVGRPLFDRLPKRVVPTHAGERLVAHAREILARVADARREVCDAEEEGTAAGAVAVGAIPTVAPFVLPGLLARLAKTHPAVEVRVTEDVTDRLIERLESGELDVAILSDHPGSRTVHVETVATDELLVMVPAGHALAKRRRGGGGVRWADLDGERFLALHDMHCLSGQVTRLCDRQRVRPSVAMRGAQLFTIAALVRAGLGVSIVPAMMCANKGSTEGCVCLPFAEGEGGPRPTRGIAAAWSLRRYRTNAARAVVGVLRQSLGAATHAAR